MGTNKPIIQAVIEPELYKKFAHIKKKEKRSNSQMASIAIEYYIKAYEAEHGEIILEETE